MVNGMLTIIGEGDMVKRPIAGVLLALFVTGCGGGAVNQPGPISNVQPVDGGTLTPVDADDEDEDTLDPGDTDPEPTAPGDEAPADGEAPDDETADPDPTLPSVGGGGGGDDVIPLKNSMFSDWQATGITVSSGQIYITASDRLGVSQKGTILTWTGDKWQDVGASRIAVPLLNKVSLGHKLNNTVRGIAADGMGNVAAIEAAGHIGYLAGGKLKEIVGGPSGLLDVVATNNVFYVSLGNQIRRMSADMTSSDAIVSHLTLTGGMGTDRQGNFYAINQGSVVKITLAGEVTPVVGYVSNPVDVAVTSKGHVLVLTSTTIEEFDAAGQPVRSFGAGQIINGAAITVDEHDRIYVADSGKSKKDSQVLAFAAR